MTHAGNSGSVEVWSKPLADGSFALLLLNRGEAPANVTASWDRDIPAGRALAPEGPAECKGEPDECEGWASSGECERNPSFMSRTCNCSCRLVAGVSQGATMGSDFGLEDNRPAVVRDLWQQKNLGVFYSAFSATIQPHAVRMVRVSFDLEANLAGQQEGGSHEAASEAVTDEPKFHEISEVHNTVQILSTGESHQGPGYCGGCSIWVTLLITENAVLLLLLAVYHIPAVQRRRSPPKADNLRL